MKVSSEIAQVSYHNHQYPDRLREISSPPTELYVLGRLPERPYIAVVGSRRPTDYGRQVTYTLAGELAAAGICIVSGLAIGIDGIAHRAALDSGGSTVAVLGSGLNKLYPVRNRNLALEIIASGHGAVISEFEPDIPAFPQHFPQRNRIIAGLCLGVIVTEADAESGSLITAKFGLDFNRQVMAVPGNITSLRSAGPNHLLWKGAVPVRTADDVLTTLGLEKNALPAPRPTPANAQEAILLQLLAEGVSSSKELIEQSRLGASQFARTISVMEISGKVHTIGAGIWVRR